MLAPYYRNFELAWEGYEKAQRRFQRILRVGVALLLAFAILIALLPAPRTAPGAAVVPPQLARVMLEEQPKPPPKPQVKPPPPAVKAPTPVPQVDRITQARRKAEKAGFVEMVRDLLVDSNATVVSNAVAALSEIGDRQDGVIFKLNFTIANKLLAALTESSE